MAWREQIYQAIFQHQNKYTEESNWISQWYSMLGIENYGISPVAVALFFPLIHAIIDNILLCNRTLDIMCDVRTTIQNDGH